MARAPWCGEAVYAEAARFRDECLIEDGSLITPGLQIWNQGLTDALETLITPVDSGTFIENLVNQLTGHADEEKQLAAEALYVALLFDSTTTPAKLKDQVTAVLDTCGASLGLPDRMSAALAAGGVANIGAGMAFRWAHVDGLLQLAREVKSLSTTQREVVFNEPRDARELVIRAFGTRAAIAGRCLLHLWYPDTFEYVVSASARTHLIARFASAAGVSGEPDQDRQIHGIRTLLQAGDPEPVNLFTPSLRRAWELDSSRWDTAVRFAQKLLGDPDFEREERQYKIEIGERLGTARQAVLERSEDALEVTRQAVNYKQNNLTDRRFVLPKFVRWTEDSPDDALSALSALWSSGDVSERIEAFLDLVPVEAVSGPGGRLSFATFLLLGEDPTGIPFFKPTAVGKFLRAVEEDNASSSTDLALGPEDAEPDLGSGDVIARYQSWCAVVDQLRWRILAATGTHPDRLDAQSVAWTLTEWQLEELPGDWNEDEKAELAEWRDPSGVPDRQDRQEDDVQDDGTARSAVLPPITGDLEAKTFLPQQWLNEVWELLGDRRQLILYGPPGTGKTFLAMALGEHVAAAGGEYRLVQFHPSYTYEDFFEGYRPRAEAGGLTFDLIPGTLKELAESARENEDKPHLLVIDEINRGNLPKIFGELYFLLEYRDKKVRLQYSREEFELPPNLYVIGTMNTADKSIALVDAALRRRFYFAGMLPTEEPVSDVLPRWLKAQERDDDAADLLNELNRRIADADFSIGPSYLMTDANNVERVWTYSIVPLLEEHFYGRGRDVPAEFGLAAIRKGLESAEQ